MSVPAELRLDVDLDAVRADGWYEDFLETIDDLDVLTATFGPRGLGHLMLAGVKIDTVAFDSSDPSGSLVDIRLPDGRLARAPARLLVRKAIEAIAEQIALSGPMPRSASADEARTFLGARTLLCAALYGIAVSRLRIGRDETAWLDITDGDDVRHVPVAEFREFLVERMNGDLALVDDARLGVEVIEAARAAGARGDDAEVLRVLDPFAGSLVSTLRAGDPAGMAPEVRAQLVEAIDLLGTAYLRKADLETAETLFRLGAQGCRGEAESARLFVRLGEVALARGSAGEAIGVLRRALALGARPRDVALPLASALADRGRHVAALAVAHDGIEDGLESSRFRDVLRASRARAGEEFDRCAERIERAR